MNWHENGMKRADMKAVADGQGKVQSKIVILNTNSQKMLSGNWVKNRMTIKHKQSISNEFMRALLQSTKSFEVDKNKLQQIGLTNYCGNSIPVVKQEVES